MLFAKRKPDYKWVILCLCFLMTFVCLGFCSGNKGLYLTAITEALGFKRSLFSINDSCRYVATAVVSLFFGSLVSRFGVRYISAFGFITLIISTLLYAFAEQMVVFYLGGTLLGVGLAFTSTTMASCIVRRWFHNDIGKYTGIVFAANGIGSAVAAQIVSPMIYDEGNPFGYRKSYLVVAYILLVVGAVVFCLLREQPTSSSETATVEKKRKTRGTLWSGIDYQTAIKRPYFYLTGAVVLLTGFILQGISGAYAAHMKDVGLDAGYIATVVSVFSLSLTFSKILVGIMYDRFGLQVIMVLCQSATVLAFLLIAFLDASVTGMVLAIIFALLYSLALPLETLVLPIIVNDLFGSASYDKILGVFVSLNYTGYAFGSPLVNFFYDTFGSYKPVFLLFSALMLLVAVVFGFVQKAADEEKVHRIYAE